MATFASHYPLLRCSRANFFELTRSTRRRRPQALVIHGEKPVERNRAYARWHRHPGRNWPTLCSAHNNTTYNWGGGGGGRRKGSACPTGRCRFTLKPQGQNAVHFIAFASTRWASERRPPGVDGRFVRPTSITPRIPSPPSLVLVNDCNERRVDWVNKSCTAWFGDFDGRLASSPGRGLTCAPPISAGRALSPAANGVRSRPCCRNRQSSPTPGRPQIRRWLHHRDRGASVVAPGHEVEVF